MGRIVRVLAVVFGLVFAGATALNAFLVIQSRMALSGGGFDGSASAKPADRHLLVILPVSDDSFFSRIVEGLEANAAEMRAAVQVERYPAASPDDADRWFDIGLRSGVDGIVMYASPGDDVAQRAAIAEAAGVVYIAVGKEAPPGVLPCFIGSAPLFQGFAGGRIITGLLAQRARIGLILPAGGTHRPENDSLYKGVAAAVATYRGAAIVATIRAVPGIFAGEEAAARLLEAHPDINAIWCATSRDTLGAAQVLVDEGLAKKIVLVGADETPLLQRYLEEGVVAASIVRDSRRIGVEAAHAFEDMEAGKPPPGIIEVDFTVLTGSGPK